MSNDKVLERDTWTKNIRSKNPRIKMRSRVFRLSAALVLVIAVLTGLCGCRRVEPELRAYPLAMGFDWSDGEYQIYYAMPDLGTYTGEGKTEKTTDLLWIYRGADYEEIDRMVSQTKEQFVDLGHVQVILLGDGLLENTAAYDETMAYLLRQPVLGSGSYLFRCEKLDEVMKENGEMTDSLGEYLSDLIHKEYGKEPAVLQDLYNAWYNGEPIPKLMMVRVAEEGIEVRKPESQV